MRKGTQRKVHTPGVNRRINVFITLLWPSKRIRYNIYKRRRAVEFKRHLSRLLTYVKRKGYRRLILITDNAKTHRCPETSAYIEKHREILHVFYLPRYSPQLNEVEGRVNRRIKHEVLANHQHKTLHSLNRATRTCLRTYNNRQKLTDIT
jgi:transposase